MGRLYEQLSLEERCEISRLRGSGSSIRQIAAALDRQPSSISRELKRNAGSGPRAGASLCPGADGGAALVGRAAGA